VKVFQSVALPRFLPVWMNRAQNALFATGEAIQELIGEGRIAERTESLLTRMSRPYSAKAVVALLAVAAIFLGAVVVYPSIGIGSTTSRQNPSSPSTYSSAIATTSSSSISTSSTKTASLSTSTDLPFDFALSNHPDVTIISPGSNLTYASVDILPLPSATASGSEMIALSATAPKGIHVRFVFNPVRFSPATLSMLTPVESVQFALAADQGIAPGDYKIAVVGTSGPVTESGSFTVRVIPYLIIARDNVFYPASLTVSSGTTVYWINLGIPTGGDNAQEFDVSFKTIGARSSVLIGSPIFDSFSYTFTTPGTYVYYCAQADDCNYPYMSGQITVIG
jgi:plastocyanin